MDSHLEDAFKHGFLYFPTVALSYCLDKTNEFSIFIWLCVASVVAVCLNQVSLRIEREENRNDLFENRSESVQEKMRGKWLLISSILILFLSDAALLVYSLMLLANLFDNLFAVYLFLIGAIGTGVYLGYFIRDRIRKRKKRFLR